MIRFFSLELISILFRQLDIGLEPYATKQLFIRLVTPTFFVIVTVIQLHYFHKDFMNLSNPRSSIQSERSEHTSAQGVSVFEPNSEKTDTSVKMQAESPHEENTFTNKFHRYMKEAYHILNLTFLFFELHMPKIVLLIAMLVCVYDKCAVYLPFLMLIVIGTLTSRVAQNVVIYVTSVMISIVLLLRMIYQIQYVQEIYVENLNVTCSNVNNSVVNITEENAIWMGFQKTSQNLSLPMIVRWNIVYILVVTFWAVILVRQSTFRLSRGRQAIRPYFMFPKVKRWDAEKNIRHCMKYLLNYGFYKFGVEVVLYFNVVLIFLCN